MFEITKCGKEKRRHSVRRFFTHVVIPAILMCAMVTICSGKKPVKPPPQSDDTTAPSAVTTLAVAHVTPGEVGLKWTAVGDDGLDGQATLYVMRFSPNDPSTLQDVDTWWDQALEVEITREPNPSGVDDACVATGLAEEIPTQYWFALKVYDEAGNGSKISNVADTFTAGPVEWIEEYVGAEYAAPAHLSLAYNPQTGDPSVAWMVGSFKYVVKYASPTLDTSTGLFVWNIEEVAPCEGGMTVPLAFSQGIPIVCYTVKSGKGKNAWESVAISEKNGSSWDETVVDTITGYYYSLAIAPDGEPAVVYLSAMQLIYAKRLNGQWSHDIVDDSARDIRDISLAFDQFGSPAVAFRIGNNQVDLASWNASSWEIEIVRTEEFGFGANCKLAFDPIDNQSSVLFGGTSNLPSEFHHKNAYGIWDVTVYDDGFDYSGRSSDLVYDVDEYSPAFGTAYISCNSSDRFDGYNYSAFTSVKCVRILRTLIDGGKNEYVPKVDIFRMYPTNFYINSTAIALSPSGNPTISFRLMTRNDGTEQQGYNMMPLIVATHPGYED